ncbi:porin [Sulfitobacter sabulilitoris]|uniref:Porin n=1 Tax=Sulfitobacter sabulilitoris TaxID=2562655 RepID=A0A5S3PHJ8_9RHOB|nr:porin [Sulfitobacter sabulilitoris]TMM51244.1 porin [Sulfitobacter sabulilitoris]
MTTPLFARLVGSAVGTALLALPGAALAQSGGTPDVTAYGHLNFGVFSVDDGTNDDTYLTDNDASNSRVGLIYETGLSNGGRFKFHFETGLGINGSAAVTPLDNDLDLEWRRTELRKFEVVYTTPRIGTFSFGQGSSATDGVNEADLSGTFLTNYSSIGDVAFGVEFRDAAGIGSGQSVGDTFNSFDGSRRFRVRYDSPTYNGFGLSASAGEEILRRGDDRAFYDIALNYDMDYGAVTVASRIGYQWIDSDEELLTGSVALLHEPTGLNATFATGRQQVGEADYAYLKLGMTRDLIAAGKTSIAVDLYEGDDIGFAGSSSTAVGFGVVQKLDAYDTEVYAGYRTYDLDGTATPVEDIDVAFVGARWKF